MPHMSFAKICKDRGISVLSYDAVPEIADMLHLTPQCQGAATIIAEHPIILVDSRMPKEELRYTIAHELGHILLGHLSFRMENGAQPPQAEMEANAFAAALIAQDLILTYGERGADHE